MSEEDWQTNVEFATVSVGNFGGASGDMTLKPLTILYGSPESGVSHVASLLHAVVLHGSSLSIFDDMVELPCLEPSIYEMHLYPDRDEARRVMVRRRPKVKFVDSKYLATSSKKHLHLLAIGLKSGLLGPDSSLRPDAAGSTVALATNRAHGRLEYTDDALEEFPDRPNLRINFVMYGTARKHDKEYFGGSGPYLAHDPYHYVGPRPYESGRDIHIDAYRGGDAEILRNVLNAGLHYYCERVSQPEWSVLVSDGGLTEYDPPRSAKIGDVIYGRREPSLRKRPKISGDTPPEKLRSALNKAERGTMIVTENPERYVDDMESFIRTLFEKANWGLYMLVVTGDQTLAERVAEMRQKSGGLDAEYISVYGFEPENGGHTIIEY